jgi:hypothetical protein
MASYVLDEGAATTLSASGAGQVTLGPKRPNIRWRVRNLAVLSDTGTPAARVYRGNASPPNLLAGTYSGGQDSTELDIELFPGQVLTVVWSDGTAGAYASASIYGELLTVD